MRSSYFRTQDSQPEGWKRGSSGLDLPFRPHRSKPKGFEGADLVRPALLLTHPKQFALQELLPRGSSQICNVLVRIEATVTRGDIEGQVATCWAIISSSMAAGFVTDVGTNPLFEVSLEDVGFI